MTPSYKGNDLLLLILLLLFTTSALSSSPPTTPTLPTATPFSTQNLQNFLHDKCQNPLTKNAAVWSYEGRLVDPNNGKIIANVEGIELVRSLSEMERPRNANTREKTGKRDLWKLVRALRRLDDLKVRSMLTVGGSGSGSTPGWDYAGTVLSRKLFCYSPVGVDGSRGGSGQLLKEYRLHPTAPVRKVKVDEAVALYDTATTFISRDGGREMVVMTEWPDGHWIQSTASSVGFRRDDNGDTGDDNGSDRTSSRTPFEFTAYARRSGRGDNPVLPPSEMSRRERIGRRRMDARGDNDRDSFSSSSPLPPPRSQIIQFGRDNSFEDQRYGARETYSYIMDGRQMTKSQRIQSILRQTVSNISERVGFWDLDMKSFPSDTTDSSRSCTVRYTRYGEAPPWYGPGKMCTLELWGKKVDSVSHAPPLAATLAATRVPGFLSVHTPIPVGPPDECEPDFGDESSNKSKKRRLGGGSKSSDQKKVQEQTVADRAAIRAVNWFRGSSLPLQVLNEDEDKRGLFCLLVDTGLSIAQRVRAATTAI